MITPPILREFPDEFESERLLIRAPRPGDGADVHAAIIESLSELRPWMPWAQGEQLVDDAEANVRLAHAEFLTRRDLRLHLKPYRKCGIRRIGRLSLRKVDPSTSGG